MNNDLSLIAPRIKKIRHSMGMSQFEFAKACHMTQAQISAYETGRAYPTLESALKICTVARVSITALIDDTDAIDLPLRKPTRPEMALWVIEEIGVRGPLLDQVRVLLLGRDLPKGEPA